VRSSAGKRPDRTPNWQSNRQGGRGGGRSEIMSRASPGAAKRKPRGWAGLEVGPPSAIGRLCGPKSRSSKQQNPPRRIKSLQERLDHSWEVHPAGEIGTGRQYCDEKQQCRGGAAQVADCWQIISARSAIRGTPTHCRTYRSSLTRGPVLLRDREGVTRACGRGRQKQSPGKASRHSARA
jgi:hypothetical protein